SKYRSWSNRQIIVVRVSVGIWLLVLSAILYSSGVGGLWELLLVGIAALHFVLAYRVFRTAKHAPDRSLRFR
ncbi:MAG: hypothetical protein ACRDPA_15705, partial [Solirubrobacteraceae bacterium]